MTNEYPSESALIADLKATWPAMHVRPLREFGKDFKLPGAWLGFDNCEMPDGNPVHMMSHCGDGYDGGIHDGFTEWLESRGWYLENYDGDTFHAIAILECSDAYMSGSISAPEVA